MRASPLFMAAIYFFMGVVFTYIAIQSADETVWNFTTIVLTIVATFDFAVGIKLVNIHFRLKNANNKKE
ncbi:YdiK family protein [Salirhabdus salicampi]|uniref:YdiK family protein n=1 Tax=Salirhabdus salicampi TaxID=476102 RepID=UPI0020C43F03|nr:YdiK family protein [Salirhabdus salicampi]MCP8617828.1 YdiK family protein [Salirhabdus salicampi]